VRNPLSFLVPLVLVACVASGVSAETAGPSFSCAKPSEIEAAICGDAVLSADDRRMTAFYQTAKSGALGLGSNQLDAQREWLKTRDKGCAKGGWRANRLKSLRDCIAGAYDDRLRALAVANLLATPRDSLAEIRRLNPKAAPTYEAVFDYATIDDPPRRAEAVEALLTPVYRAMDQNSKDHLVTAAGAAMTAHDAARSDSAFTAFFVVSGALENIDLTWPCAVLLKRPGLIGGLGSFFGGAIDGAVPGSDCDAAMPPVSEVTQLRENAVDVQPPCEGTIRFSLARDYEKLGDAVLLHRTDLWAPRADARDRPGPDETAFRRDHVIKITAAERVLAAYYGRYFGVASNMAARDAETAADAVVSGAFSLCD